MNIELSLFSYVIYSSAEKQKAFKIKVILHIMHGEIGMVYCYGEYNVGVNDIFYEWRFFSTTAFSKGNLVLTE